MRLMLVGLLLFLSSIPGWGAPTCGRIFDRIEETLSTPSYNIKSIDWLTTSLKSGELFRLRLSDPYKDHSQFLSNILRETSHIVKEDFKKSPEFQTIPHAEKFLNIILSDISIAQIEGRVTHEFFVKSNAAIAALMSFKNPKDAGKNIVQETSVQNYYDDVTLKASMSFRIMIDGGFVPFPTFVELTMRDFLRLGMNVAPLGMTLNAKSNYDGVRGETASALFAHDISHALLMHIRLVHLTPSERTQLGRINHFLMKESSYSHLTPQERVVVEGFFFNVIHEDAGIKQLLNGFTQRNYYLIHRDIYSQQLGAENSTVYRSYDRLSDKSVNFEYSVDVPYSVYEVQIREAVTKFVDKYFESQN